MRNGVAFRWLTCLVIPLLAAVAVGKTHPKHAAKGAKTLYVQLGGKPAVTKLVDDFVKRCVGDKRIKRFFASTASNPKRLSHFKKNLADQVCQVTGGPCKYHGKNMTLAHQGMNVGEADFEAMMSDLRASMKHVKVPSQAQGKLLGMLTPMKAAIVHTSPATPVVTAPATAPAEEPAMPPPAREMASDPAGTPAGGTPDSPPSPE